jgi:Fe-S-cluster-containing hydrogenase component 2
MFKTSAVVAITDEKCVGCQRCVSVCPSDALAMNGRLAVLDEPRCVGCFKCVEACYPYNAISITANPNPTTLTVPEDEYEQPSVDDLCAKARYAPDAMVCLCTGTTAAEIAAAIVDGVHVPEDLALATGVRAKCGMWCLAGVMRLLDAHGVSVERSAKDHRIYTDGCGTHVGIWTIPDEVADKYPEYRLKENLAAVEDGTILNSPNPAFPDVAPAPEGKVAR